MDANEWRMGAKGQVSSEYLMITGVVLVFISIMLVLSTYYARDMTDQVSLNQVDRLAHQIIDTAEQVFYWGSPTRVTINAYIPAGVNSISIANNEVYFVVNTQQGPTDIAYKANVTMIGSIRSSPGLRKIKVEAQDGFVLVNGT